MPFKLARAHRRFLGLIGPPEPRSDRQVETVERLGLSAPAKAFFYSVLEGEGIERGGPLFGYTLDGVLHVEQAMLQGYPCSEVSPFAVDASYLLGLTDAFQRVSPQWDWIGHWHTSATNNLLPTEDLFDVVARARSHYMLTRHHYLVQVGWQEGQMQAQLCIDNVTDIEILEGGG